MDIKDILFELSRRDAVGNITAAADYAFEILNKYTSAERGQGLTVTGFLKGESDYTVMLDAHIDQIAFVVTNVDKNGFVTVAKSGGIDLRALPARRVTVHGKQDVSAVFCSTPPHLSKGERLYEDIADIKLDTALGEKAAEIISVGDYVTFAAEPCCLNGGLVTGRSFDDRSGVACLLEVCSRLSGKRLPVNVAFVFSDGEELGMRGVRPAAFNINPDEAVAVDVSFGDGIGISEEECGKLGKGAMIGFSPSLSSEASKKLCVVAEENGISYQTEVMGDTTGTNADMIGVSRGGVKTATVSIPLRNMHTEVEVLNTADLESVCDLLEKYIMSGGCGA